jgi:hypothetical protein
MTPHAPLDQVWDDTAHPSTAISEHCGLTFPFIQQWFPFSDFACITTLGQLNIVPVFCF